MSLPHTILSLAAATALWFAGHGLFCTQPSLPTGAEPPVFALPSSAYGSLMARLLRDSLYSYWHGGESATPVPQVTADKNALPPPPPPGRFARKSAPAPIATPPVQADTSWLEGRVASLAQLEKGRTRRNNALPLSPAHQRYLNSAADLRLRLAYRLDLGDAFLYEILAYHISTHAKTPEEAQTALVALSKQAMAYGLRDAASLSDTLSGAGAAITLLNDQLRPENKQRDSQVIASYQDVMKRCLTKYNTIRSAAQNEGWWGNIPPIRKQELEDHAKLLNRISGMISKTISAQPVSDK